MDIPLERSLQLEGAYCCTIKIVDKLEDVKPQLVSTASKSGELKRFL